MVIERDTDSVHAYYELSDENWFLNRKLYATKIVSAENNPSISYKQYIIVNYITMTGKLTTTWQGLILT